MQTHAAKKSRVYRRKTVSAAAIVVRPKTAMEMLNCGRTRLYEMLAAGELDSYLDAGARQITVESIHRRIERLRNGPFVGRYRRQTDRGIGKLKEATA
jgi:hypothetical protein